MRNRLLCGVLCISLFAVGCATSRPAHDATQQSASPTTQSLATNPPPGGYLDLNKNGRMDPYENPKLDIEKRIDNLLSLMTVEEKTCQMATLYGYPRVLKDDLPKAEWKQAVWKDGIANIDEHLNGWRGGRGADVEGQQTTNQHYWPASEHA